MIIVSILVTSIGDINYINFSFLLSFVLIQLFIYFPMKNYQLGSQNAPFLCLIQFDLVKRILETCCFRKVQAWLWNTRQPVTSSEINQGNEVTRPLIIKENFGFTIFKNKIFDINRSRKINQKEMKQGLWDTVRNIHIEWHQYEQNMKSKKQIKGLWHKA